MGQVRQDLRGLPSFSFLEYPMETSVGYLAKRDILSCLSLPILVPQELWTPEVSDNDALHERPLALCRNVETGFDIFKVTV